MGTWRRPMIRNAKEPEYTRRRKRAGWGRIKLRQRMRKGFTGKGWRWRRGRYRPVLRYQFGRWKQSAFMKMGRSERKAYWAKHERG